MVPSLQDRATDEEFQKVCLCRGWAIIQEGNGEIPAGELEVGSSVSQADTSEYFGIPKP